MRKVGLRFVFLLLPPWSFFGCAHLRDERSLIPRYVYSSFCDNIGNVWYLYWMFWALWYVMNVIGCSLDLLGHHVIAYLFIPRSICAHSKYCLSLLS